MFRAGVDSGASIPEVGASVAPPREEIFYQPQSGQYKQSQHRYAQREHELVERYCNADGADQQNRSGRGQSLDLAAPGMEDRSRA